MRQARKRPGDRQFHDWRKRVKDHWYHCRLLKYLWPEPMRTGRVHLNTDIPFSSGLTDLSR